MERLKLGALELLIEGAGNPEQRGKVLFVHGAFAGAWVWAERFLPFFSAEGFLACALSLRGHGNSDGHDHIDSFGIRDYVDDLAAIVEWLGGDVVLLGHSMGGFVVQKYLERHPVRAAVLMCSVPPQGLLASSFHLAMKRPGLFLDINGLMGGRDIAPDSVAEALFAHDFPRETLRGYSARMSLESQRALWDMTMFNLVALHTVHRTPLMVLGTEDDQLIPPFLVQSTARAYGVDDHLFRGFGHAFMLEPGCERIADAVVAWLRQLSDE